jgi:hypothetical protein
MTREVRHAGWTGAWAAIAVCALAACNAAPGSNVSTARAEASGRSVVEDVRLATDRAAAQRDVVTLPNGERMRRVSLGNGFSHVLVGKMGPDGKPSVSCVDRASAAESFLAGNKQGDGQ